MNTVAFYTLGCKVNQYETEAMTELFQKSGYQIVEFDSPADIYVINTCTVTNMSDRKSRQIIRRARKNNPDALIAVSGCYAQTAPEQVSSIEGVNLVIGTKDRADIVRLVEEANKAETVCKVGDILHDHTFEHLHITQYENRTRAYIKIQDGCSQFCSYCIIPYARGPVRSRPLDEIIEEVTKVSQKFCEIVFVGIHVASYGRDLEHTTLSDLLLAANQIDAVKRIRLSSIEPMTLDETFVAKIKDCDKLCHHFHLSLQSGCDETLARMNRKYTTKGYKAIVDGLREVFPDVAITTDIMVGFPGETDEEFADTLAFVDEISFSDAHIFQYSPRKGTPAARMADQISAQIKEMRSKQVSQITKQSRHAFLSRFIGMTMPVLFEQWSHTKDGYFEGKTSNYMTIVCPASEDLSGQICLVRLDELKGDVIEGSII